MDLETIGLAIGYLATAVAKLAADDREGASVEALRAAQLIVRTHTQDPDQPSLEPPANN